MSRHRPVQPFVRKAALAICISAAGFCIPTGCLDRPLAPQQPVTTRNALVVVPNSSIDKIDLLFMIDNSGSMADKQAILAQAVPDLLNRLTQPDCIREEPADRIPGSTVDSCPEDYRREFKPVQDIRIGVVSSSLELPGSDQCTRSPDVGLITRKPGEEGPGQDIDGRRYIEWNPDNPVGSTERFAELVRGVGETGCGYESNLESWYRFLVDSAPPSTWEAVPCHEADDQNRCRVPGPPDTRVLSQRKSFLRHDSLLAIIMLSDENDCSINPLGQGWFASSDNTNLTRGTLACDTNPDSPECMSCADSRLDLNEHPECKIGLDKPDSDYNNNLRCWDQKRRFGADFLYPVERYVRALTEVQIDGMLNPIFCPETDPSDPTGQTCKTALRPRNFVFLGGIVGIPWQNIAKDPKDLSRGYLPADRFSETAPTLEALGVDVPGGVDEVTTLWDVILGPTHENHAPMAAAGPIDPLMQESVLPRTGINPSLGVSLERPEATNPWANPINGHEWNAQLDAQLQFSCIFDLPEPIECGPGVKNCDCTYLDGRNNPLCQEEHGNYTNTQRRAKAYPGLRQLAVLKGVGKQGITASICPATMDSSRSDYGYRPAVEAIVDRLAEALSGACWNEPIEAAEDGSVPCVVFEATKGELDANGTIQCEPCEGIRQEPSPSALSAVASHELFLDNKMNCLCEVKQAPSETGALQACIEEIDPAAQHEGWCYVDPSSNPSASKEALGSCRRMIRFVSDPQPNSLTFIQCRGATF